MWQRKRAKILPGICRQRTAVCYYRRPSVQAAVQAAKPVNHPSRFDLRRFLPLSDQPIEVAGLRQPSPCPAIRAEGTCSPGGRLMENRREAVSCSHSLIAYVMSGVAQTWLSQAACRHALRFVGFLDAPFQPALVASATMANSVALGLNGLPATSPQRSRTGTPHVADSMSRSAGVKH